MKLQNHLTFYGLFKSYSLLPKTLSLKKNLILITVSIIIFQTYPIVGAVPGAKPSQNKTLPPTPLSLSHHKSMSTFSHTWGGSPISIIAGQLHCPHSWGCHLDQVDVCFVGCPLFLTKRKSIRKIHRLITKTQ